jgi:UDP-N-acetylglucosamine 1-carboxyvinyltransferase
MPDLADTRFLGDILVHLGAQVERYDRSNLHLHVGSIKSRTAPYDLVRKMRASFNVLGPLLAREGEADVSLPGGCAIGARPVDLHLSALRALGAEIDIAEGYVRARARRGLRGTRIEFPFVSVGATEHTLLAAVLAKGQTEIANAAREPEIVDLAECLNSMGASIAGAGTSTIVVEGVERLTGARHRVVPDRIETGTYAFCAAAAGGEVALTGVVPGHNRALWAVLEAAGVSVEEGVDTVTISRSPGAPILAGDIETSPYPGYPTDLQAQFMALMTRARGKSRVRETIFENRFMHVPELQRFGADIRINGREAQVTGVEHLNGAPVMATDLRASVSLIVAALMARGTTKVARVYHLDRGFEHLEAKLSACGANIRRVTE